MRVRVGRNGFSAAAIVAVGRDGILGTRLLLIHWDGQSEVPATYPGWMLCGQETFFRFIPVQ